MWNGIVGKQAANPPPRIGLLIRGLLSEGLCVIRLQMTQLLFHLWDTMADSPRIFTWHWNKSWPDEEAAMPVLGKIGKVKELEWKWERKLGGGKRESGSEIW